MYRLCQERQSFETYFQYVYLELQRTDVCSPHKLIGFLIGTYTTTEIDGMHLLLPLLISLVHSDTVINDPSITVQNTIENTLSPTHALLPMNLTIYERMLGHIETMTASYASDPFMYNVTYMLMGGHPIQEVYSMFEHTCPPFLQNWHLLVTGNYESELVVRLQMCDDLAIKIRKDPCYVYLSTYIESDILFIHECATSELFLTYEILNDMDLQAVLTRVNIPDGLRMLIEDCVSKARKTDDTLRAMDVIYIMFGACCLILVGIYLFLRFRSM